MLKAIVTKETSGVPDGQVYPVMHAVGAEVTGDLARDAIESGWGKQTDGDPVVAAAATAPEMGQSTAGGTDGAGAEKIIVPADWEALDTPQLLELASKIAGEQVTKNKSAKTIIKAHLDGAE